jgi:hypothetical protein
VNKPRKYEFENKRGMILDDEVQIISVSKEQISQSREKKEAGGDVKKSKGKEMWEIEG